MTAAGGGPLTPLFQPPGYWASRLYNNSMLLLFAPARCGQILWAGN